MSGAVPPKGGAAPRLRDRRGRRQRFTPFALLIGLLGSLVVSGGVGTTYSVMTASVRNAVNTAGTGTLVLQETANADDMGDTGCTSFDGPSNSLDCTTFNKYGGTALQPGGTVVTRIRIINVGSLTSTAFTLTPGTCTIDANPLGGSGDICGKLAFQLSCTRFVNGVSQGAVNVTTISTLASISGTVFDLKTAKNCMPPPGTWGGPTYTRFDFTVSLSTSAGTEVQGQTAKQTLKWQMTAG